MTSKIKGSSVDEPLTPLQTSLAYSIGMLDPHWFEHKTGVTRFQRFRVSGRVKYFIHCLDEEGSKKWELVAFGWVKSWKHLKKLRRINKLEQAIFA